MSTASLMIVTYNRLELTKQMLSNLFEVTDYPFDIVFVDNASADGTVDYIYRYCGDMVGNHPHFKGFSVQPNGENVGIAHGRNQALLAAKGEWLSTLDNDVILPKGWLTECISILKENPTYGMIGVNFEKETFPLVKNGSNEWQHKPRGNLGTACTVFNRSLHKLLGFFNTEYGLYGEEDADFGMRVRVAGFKLGYLKANGTHIGEGENDVGEYREFKTACHKANLAKFNRNCGEYMSRRKSIYIKYP